MKEKIKLSIEFVLMIAIGAAIGAGIGVLICYIATNYGKI